ncbi:CHAT domain-containing protein [Streptomyces sp. NPDC001843]|uniref:CHAT domain-containing protein n=1 Tax=Streptomyces sp. NPDC001843 TaxID=3364617 RepID=UPI0036CBBE33
MNRRNMSRAIVEAARKAALSAARTNTIGRIGAARTWADAAEHHGGPDDAADAFRHLVLMLCLEVPTRVDMRTAHLTAGQNVAAEAAYWMLCAERPQEAVQVLEHVRAILLSRMLRGTDAPRLSELRRRGAAGAAAARDLLKAQQELSAVLRQDLTRIEAPGAPAAHRSPADLIRSQREEAHNALWRAEQAADKLMPSAKHTLIPFETIRSTAEHGPLIYLASAKEQGYAVIVTPGEGAQSVQLPQLKTEELDEQVLAMSKRASRAGAVQNALEVLRAGLEPLAAKLAGELTKGGSRRIINLIPVGKISVLPVHAALLDALPNLQGVRYAANARMLRHAAEHHRESLRHQPLSGAYVTDTSCKPLPKLPLGRVLVEDLLSGPNGYCQKPRERGDDKQPDKSAGREDLSATLCKAGIVQVCCHGNASERDALDSYLFAKDDKVTVRDMIVSGPVRARLIALLACESHIGDLLLHDEAIGIPGALTQAGAGAVVAVQWECDTRAAALLLHEFHSNLRSGLNGPEALAGAQRWLRTATVKTLLGVSDGAYYKKLRPELGGEDPESVPYAAPEFWAGWAYTGL